MLNDFSRSCEANTDLEGLGLIVKEFQPPEGEKSGGKMNACWDWWNLG